MDRSELLHIVESTSTLSELKEADFPALKVRGLGSAVAGWATIEGKRLEIAVGVSDKFPLVRPIIFLLNQTEIEILPHVEPDGFICYTHDDTIVLDIDNPVGIIYDCIELALKTLEDGILRKNEEDFYNEYEAYWRRLKNGEEVFINIAIKPTVSLLKYVRVKETTTLFVTDDEEERINSYSRFYPHHQKGIQYLNALYIPLEPGSKIFIPKPTEILQVDDIRRLIDQFCSEKNKKLVSKHMTRSKVEDVFIFSLPQPNGYHSFFGVKIRNTNSNAAGGVGKGNVIPLKAIRLDPEYMVARGGNGVTFFGKKVLVIGAGAVGGVVCEELVRAGVLYLDVIDNDKLMVENPYRHICGTNYMGRYKADAVKAKLETFYPHAHITSIPRSVEFVLTKQELNLKYDAVVVATGNATINMFLNRFFMEKMPGVPVLFTWLDPYGIGGHVLVTNIENKGCYQCLYTNEELNNDASFADKDQPRPFAKNISGCGTVYVPYGSLDANETAILAVRKLMQALTSMETGNSIYSWKGDSSLFVSEGYKLSERYFLPTEWLLESKTGFINPKCKACGSKRNSV